MSEDRKLKPENVALVLRVTGNAMTGSNAEWSNLEKLLDAARAEGLRPSVLGERVSREIIAKAIGDTAVNMNMDIAGIIADGSPSADVQEVLADAASSVLALLPEPAGEPVGWGLLNPDTGRYRNALCPAREAAEGIASRRSDNYLTLEARALFAHPAPVKADTAAEGWSEALARLKSTDAELLDEAALRLSEMGAVELGNAVVSATVSITEARDAMLAAAPPPTEGAA